MSLLVINRAHFGTVYQSSRWTDKERDILTRNYVRKKGDEIWIRDYPETRAVLIRMKISGLGIRADEGHYVSYRNVLYSETQNRTRELSPEDQARAETRD